MMTINEKQQQGTKNKRSIKTNGRSFKAYEPNIV